jgi:hypothetical protein
MEKPIILFPKTHISKGFTSVRTSFLFPADPEDFACLARFGSDRDPALVVGYSTVPKGLPLYIKRQFRSSQNAARGSHVSADVFVRPMFFRVVRFCGGCL